MVPPFLLLLRSKKLAVFTAVVGTAILSSFNSIAGENCDWEELIIYNGITRQATFCVELATTYSERQQGLMFREDLEINEGMIFVYDQPKPVSFWMKNTSIPLDIIFADGWERNRNKDIQERCSIQHSQYFWWRASSICAGDQCGII